MAPENEPVFISQADSASHLTSEQLRAQLVAYLVREGAIRSTLLEQAFYDIPREFFLPRELPLTKVYADEAIVVKWDEKHIPTSSSTQPFLMADMLEALQVKAGLNVLEIGAGVGYNAAILGYLLGDGACLTSLELDPVMAQIARENLGRLAAYRPEPGFDRVRVINTDGSQGFPNNAPYDRIIVTVQQWEISPHWVEQLKVGGLLLLPLTISPHLWGGVIPTFEKQPNGHLRSVGVVQGSFMLMRGEMAHPSNQPWVVPIPIEAGQIWPEVTEQARLAFSIGSKSAPLSIFLQDLSEVEVEPSGDIYLELNGSPDLDLTPARLNYLSYRTFQGFVLALSSGQPDRLFTLMVGHPATPEDNGEGMLIDGWRFRARGLALAYPAGNQAYDLAVFVTPNPLTPRTRLLSSWRLSRRKSSTDTKSTTNLAAELVLATWQNWQDIGQPGFFDWSIMAFPVSEPPPLPGHIINRRFYNLLLPFQAKMG